MLWGKKVSGMTSKSEKKIFDDSAPVQKRYKHLSAFTESTSVDPTELQNFYEKNFPTLFRVYEESIQFFDKTAKESKKPKTISTTEAINCIHILKNIIRFAGNEIKNKLNLLTIVQHIQQYLDNTNLFTIRKAAFECLVLLIDTLSENTEDLQMNLLLHTLDLSPFAPGATIKLPVYKIGDLKEKFMLPKITKPGSQLDESLEFFTYFFQFLPTSVNPGFWWKTFKSKLAYVLYPKECKEVGVSKESDIGFSGRCPDKIHLLVLDYILKTLAQPEKSAAILEGHEDIKLCLAIFRQNRCIPTENVEAAQAAIKPIREWVIRDGTTYALPKIVETDFNGYLRIFIYTLVHTFFMEASEEKLDVQVNMCYEVLQIFSHFKNISDKVDADTWKYLLTTYFELYSQIVQRKSKDKAEAKFGNYLHQLILRDLFVLIITLHPTDGYDSQWSSFTSLVEKNFEEGYMQELWKNTTINLTKTLAINLFEQPESLVQDFSPYVADVYEFDWQKKKFNVNRTSNSVDLKTTLLNLPQDDCLFLWHKMLCMYSPSENNKLNNALYTVKINTIASIITLFLNISLLQEQVVKGQQMKPFAKSPEGNRLISLFGEWLFDACEREDPLFVDGRYAAYSALCKIFSTKFSQPFETQYLSLFYRTVHLGLTSKATDQTKEAIILNSCNFFSLGHKGAFILVPDFIRACENIILDKKRSQNLQLAAVRIMISIIHLCDYYKNIPLPVLDEEQQKDVSVQSYHNFTQLSKKIFQTLLEFVSGVYDTKYSNVQKVATWGIMNSLYRELLQEQIDPQSLKPSLNRLVKLTFHETDEVAITMQDMFAALATLKILSKLPSDVCKSIIVEMCTGLQNHLQDQTSVREAPICVNMFYTLADIVTNIPTSIIETISVAGAIMSAIEAGITLSTTKVEEASPRKQEEEKEEKNPLKELGDAAQVLLVYMLNVVGEFPTPLGPSEMSSDIREYDLMTQKDGMFEPTPTIQHFSFNNGIYTVMQSPDDKDAARIIVRDISGRYCWDYKCSYRVEDMMFKHEKNMVSNTYMDDLEEEAEKDEAADSSEKQTEDEIKEQSSFTEFKPTGEFKIHGYPKFSVEINTDKTDLLAHLFKYYATVFPELEEFTNNTVTPIKDQEIGFSSLIDTFSDQSKQEQELLNEMDKNDKRKVFMECVPPKYEKKEVYKATRHLLSNLGLIGKHQTCFVRLEESSKLYLNLKLLDKIAERETMKIGLLYVANGQETQKEILMNEKGSDLYSEFVHSLGWEVDLTTHKGFDGLLDINTTGKTTIYYADSTAEVVFHVATFMPTKPNDAQQVHKKKHIGNDFVRIVWSEHDRDYRPWTITSQFGYVNIVIYPLKFGLFRVQIFSKPEVPIFGPLVDGMLIDKKALGPLVRQTAMNAQRACRCAGSYHKEYKKPFPARKEMIEEIIQKFTPTEPLYKMYLEPFFLLEKMKQSRIRAPSQLITTQ